MRDLLYVTLLMCLLTTLSACEGGLQSGDRDEASGPSSPNQPSDEPEARKPHGPALDLEREQIVLLPFQVRLNKLAAVAGVPATDPIFEQVVAQRFELGDHNYAQSIRPDLSWSAQRMSRWVRSIKPICASQAMRARFPTLPEHMNELVIAAYGREAGEDDLQLVEEVLAEVPLQDEATRYQTLCLAILSSTEFVAQ